MSRLPTKRERKRRARRLRRRQAILAPLILGTALSASNLAWAQGLPTGGQVVAGQASIATTSQQLNVTAATARSIIHWESFNVGANQAANFNLPSTQAAVLNRVTGGLPSNIAGNVSSNGHVVLVNPAGVMVTATGRVNTNGFTASTFDVGNRAFMQGGPLQFEDNGSTASVVNHGVIATGTAGAQLIAKEIANHGVMTSEGGNISLATGGTVTLDDGTVYVQPSLSTLAQGISPTAGLIQNTGTIRATGAATSGGEVYLVNPNGSILHDGTIAARHVGDGNVATGGTVRLEGEQITLQSNSSIDVRGTHGGGNAFVGGEWQGSGTMQQATTVTMETGATIDASALDAGDGGTIVLWSDVTNLESVTRVLGNLLAKAGESFGDGGRIETSGHQLDVAGSSVDAGAANGKGGHWLLDPFNYVIDAVAASNIVGTLNTGTDVTVTTTANVAAQGSSGNSGDSGDITVSADITTGAMAGDATLTLQADRHIRIEGTNGIDATQNGNTSRLSVKLWADADDSGDGINIFASSSIRTNGGSLTVGNGNTASIGGSTVQVGGDIYVNGGTAQLIETSGGDITINGETIVANSNGLTVDAGSGDILFNGVVNSGNTYSGVNSTLDWGQALTAAKSGTGDAIGDRYLATITSRLENAIAGISVDYEPSWLGGRRVIGIGTDSSWRWVAGPEGLQDSGNGLVYAVQETMGGVTPAEDAFNNWNSGEPNNWTGSANGAFNQDFESAHQFTGTQGQWNDLPASGTTLDWYVQETNASNSPLTINTTGSLVFQGGVGGSKPLEALAITAGSVNINGNALISSGAQSVSTDLSVASATTLRVEAASLDVLGNVDFSATGGDLTVDALLDATGDVQMVSANDLRLHHAVSRSGNANTNLQLKSDRHVVLDNGADLLTTGGTHNVKLWADADLSGDGIISVFSDQIETNGGSVTFGNGDTASIGGSTVKVGGDVYFSSGNQQAVRTLGGDITIHGETIVANSSVGGVTFDSGGGNIAFGGLLNSGNQYTYVDGPDGQANAWDWARTDARNGTAGGAAEGDSYLVTITSRLENAIAGIAADYRGAWIGAHRSAPASSYDWTWADGPEAAQVFFVQANPNGGTTQSGWYSNFGANEPNGLLDPNGESRGQFFGNAGQWNDLGATIQFSATQDSQYSVLGYVRETNLAATPVTINAGAGMVTMDGGVGNSKPLASLDVTSASTTINGNSLITTGTQNFSSALTVTSTISLKIDGTTLTTGGAVDFTAAGNADVDAALVVPGAISIEGSEVVINGDLTSSGTGDIYLIANAQTGDPMASNGTISKTGGDRSTLTLRSGGRASLFNVSAIGTALDVVIWSDYQNAEAGGASIFGTISSNGGHVWVGGSSTNAGSNTWNGLTVGDGPSVGNINANWNALDLYGDIQTSGGDVLLWAGDGHSTGIDGIGMPSARSIQSGSGDIRLIANDVAGAVLTINATGDFTYQPHGSGWTNYGSQFDFAGTMASTTFTGTGDSSWLQIENYSSLGGMTLGKDGNTTGIRVYDPVVINGDVNLLGNFIVVDEGVDTSAASGGDVLLKASGNITHGSNVDILTNGGNVTLWSDSDDNGAGSIALGAGSTVLTGGGNIVFGGGLDANTDHLPDGDAIGDFLLVDGANFRSGISLHETTLDTRASGVMDANAGNITLKGTSTHTGGDRAVGVMLFETKLIGNVVDVTGAVTDTGGTTTRYGISANGDVTPNNTQIQSFGGITLTGNAVTPADQYSIRWGTNHEMSVVDGDIRINSDGQLLYLSSQTLTIPDQHSLIYNSNQDGEWRNIIAGAGGLVKQGSGELVLTAQNTYTGATDIDAGDLVIRHDTPGLSTSQFNGPGNLTIESAAASFSSPVSINAIDSVGSLTVGTSTNTADVTFNQNISSTGAIRVTGGALDFGGTVAAGSGNITLVGNSLALADTVSSTGTLAIRPSTNGTSIGVGTGGGSLHVSLAELSLLQDGFSSITIGSADAGELQVGGLTALQDDLTLRAGSAFDLQVSDAISWASDNAFTLAAGQDIWILDDIDVNGSSASLNLFYGGTDGTTSPNASNDFYLDLANRRTIDFASTTANLKLGNEAYTLIDSVADFVGMNAAGRYAWANGLDLSGATYSDAVYTTTFAGKLDGLGHAADGMVIRNTTGGNLGLFAELNGSTVRHLGVTNFNVQTNSSSTNSEFRIGGLVGNVGGAGTPVSSVSRMDGVWTTGTISTAQGSTQKFFFGGGLVGSQNGGFMNISRSYSTANVSTEGSYADNLATGGLVGDIGVNTNLLQPHTQTSSAVVDFAISTSYATGSIVQGSHGAYFGSGGLIGVIFTSGGELTDSYSWGNVVGSGSFGGIAGFALTGSYERNYTTQASVGAGSVATASSYNGSTLPTATNNGTQLPSGWSSDVWAVASRPTLRLLPTPPTPLYVQVVSGGSSLYGDPLGVNYTIVDELGAAVTFGSGLYGGLTGTSGAGTYTIGDDAHAGNYSVSYLSGLALTGNDADEFTLNPFSTAGPYSVTARPVTVSLANTGVTKVYDSTDAAPSGFTPDYTFANLIAGDTDASVSATSTLYNSKDVSSATTLTISGLSLTGITGSNGSQTTDYQLANSSADVAATITPKAISVSGLTALDKVYDGTVTATIDSSGVSFSGVISGDDLSFANATGTFADKFVGVGKTVSIANAIFSGADAGNYTITPQTTATADITPFAITIQGITANDKTYDATNAATLSGTASISPVVGDDVQLAGTTLSSFADGQAGVNKPVSVTGYGLTGTDAANYQLQVPSLQASILPAPLTITAIDDAKLVTAADPAGFLGATFEGFVTNEDVGVLSGALAISRVGVGVDESAGVYTDALVPGGLTSGNYNIQFVPGDFEIIAADQLLIRFADTSNVYGTAANFTLQSAEYFDSTGGSITSLSNSGTGNQVQLTDGVGGSASFTTIVETPQLSTGGEVAVGNYAIGADSLVVSGGNFSNNIRFFGRQTVTPAPVSVVSSGVQKVYDGNTTTTNLTLNLNGLVSGDLVGIQGQGNFASRHAGTNLDYAVSQMALSGFDSENYYLSGGASLAGNDGVIVAKPVNLMAPTVARVYDGTDLFQANASQLQAMTTSLGVTGDSVSAIQLTFDDKHVGQSKVLTPSAAVISDGNGGNNYAVTYVPSVNNQVSRLSSVTWIGGTTGHWNDPANWAGGAVPDLANVANVIIPDGVTPTFDASVTGPVDIDTLMGGDLDFDSGTMNVAGDATLGRFDQTGGLFTVGGNFLVDDFDQSGGTIDVTGNFDVTNSFMQSGSGNVFVGGDVDILHTAGTLGIQQMTVGGNTRLDSTTGGIYFNNLDVAGDLTGIAQGDITQNPQGALIIGGTTTLTTPGDVLLDGSNNDFRGPVNVTAQNAVIHDATGDLTLGDVDIDGSFEAVATGGSIYQTTNSHLVIGGESTFRALDDILLNGANNDFVGPVNLDGTNVEIHDHAGDLLLGNVNATQDFFANATQGSLRQTSTGSVVVGNTATLNSRDAVELGNPSNDFQGIVNSNAPRFTIGDIDGSVEFGEVAATTFKDTGTQSIASSVFDTNTRYNMTGQSNGNGNSATGGISNVVNRIVNWIRDRLPVGKFGRTAEVAIEVVQSKTEVDGAGQTKEVIIREREEDIY